MTPTTPEPDAVEVGGRTTPTKAARTNRVSFREVIPTRHSGHLPPLVTGIPQSRKKRRILAGDKPPLRDGYSAPSVMLVPPKLVGPPGEGGAGGEIEATTGEQ